MATTRRLRAFKRWMKSNGFEWSDALEFVDTPEEGLAVRALCQMNEGEVVAKMPKEACLTIKTSGACDIIENACLGGYLGLAVAIMYERSLGGDSPWAGYLQLLPQHECLPLVWTLDEVNQLLCGTELHQTVQEDKTLVYEDWQENILPLLESEPSKLNPTFFGVEQYFAAKSLISSRSFEIDDYHGFGMVPLADLFNHKTGAEDVHFTALSSNDESDDDNDDDDDDDDVVDGFDDGIVDEEALAQNGAMYKTENGVVSDVEYSSVIEDDTSMLEMVMIKDVSSGVEVFNTYGILGNAALLHRYGFTEKDNTYDIVNIDLEIVLQWCSSLFSDRHSRSRISLWRRLGYSSDSENSEYFEISFDGEPQIELLILLYIIFLTDDVYHKLDLSVAIAGNCHESNEKTSFLNVDNIFLDKASNMSKKTLLTKEVCDALLSLADIRDSLYGMKSIEDDIEALERCRFVRDRKLYHSLVLRISERKILQKLRNYASKSCKITNPISARKKSKKTTKRKS
ncbi:ribulose-1,5 bisphosphate carboxylase/oxygenase large subunit N-methyltransferase, chloroplastic [Trifolium repens]|nr:ribulose-1,5 bisphosphate carboxylase/oxygenase large subunit N-methyltransferase, chloroplastic [Trifolium repens]